MQSFESFILVGDKVRRRWVESLHVSSASKSFCIDFAEADRSVWQLAAAVITRKERMFPIEAPRHQISGGGRARVGTFQLHTGKPKVHTLPASRGSVVWAVRWVREEEGATLFARINIYQIMWNINLHRGTLQKAQCDLAS